MNLDDIDIHDAANEGRPMKVLGPNGLPVFKVDEDGETTDQPVTITLLGQDSDALTRIMNQRANRYLAKPQGATTVEAATTLDIQYLAKATVTWDGLGISERETPFSEEKAIEAYRKYPWLREQVRRFINDRANFTKAALDS